MTGAAKGLASAKIGQEMSIRGFSGGREISERLQELGFTPGTPVRLVARAAFGGPLAFRLRGGVVALRRSDAAGVEV
jgi:ferrous iron transport protein A